MRVNKNNQFINCQQNTVASGDWRLRTEIIHYAEQSRILRQSQWLCNNHFNHHSHQADQHDAHRFPRSAAIRSSFFLFVREQNKKKKLLHKQKMHLEFDRTVGVEPTSYNYGAVSLRHFSP